MERKFSSHILREAKLLRVRFHKRFDLREITQTNRIVKVGSVRSKSQPPAEHKAGSHELNQSLVRGCASRIASMTVRTDAHATFLALRYLCPAKILFSGADAVSLLTARGNARARR